MTNEQAFPAALRAFHDAIHALAGRQTLPTEGGYGVADSLFEQLVDALDPDTTPGSGGHAKSTPPCRVDVIDLHSQIAGQIRTWVPGRASTRTKLHDLADRPWSPPDTAWLQAAADTITAWCHQIRDIIDPPRRWTLPAPCPACGTATVHRQDGAGDTVRQPALQLGPHGCQCQACRHVWSPDLFAHLARTLGTLPANVLE